MGYCFRHDILPNLMENYQNINQFYINTTDQSIDQSIDQSTDQSTPTIDQFITALCIMSVMFEPTD